MLAHFGYSYSSCVTTVINFVSFLFKGSNGISMIALGCCEFPNGSFVIISLSRDCLNITSIFLLRSLKSLDISEILSVSCKGSDVSFVCLLVWCERVNRLFVRSLVSVDGSYLLFVCIGLSRDSGNITSILLFRSLESLDISEILSVSL